LTEIVSNTPAAPGPRGAEPGGSAALATAVRRARWTIFWERLWPALATLATAAGLFLTVSWLGVWLWLPPLGRAVAVFAFAVIALAAAAPFVFVRIPAIADGLRRLDRTSGLRHRPATALVDALAVTPSDSYSLALWNAHVERARAAAQTFRPGWPSPRIAGRDPYALRALVLIACIATFVAAGGERWKRIAAAFDWQGVVLPANFRVDAWVTPPPYTGKPPVILAGIHPGETARVADAAGEPVTVPAGSILVVRATGKLNLTVANSGGVAAVNEATHAPSGTEEHRFKITSTGTATLRGVGDDLTWAFNATPDKAPTIALTKDPEQQNRGSLLLNYRVEDDYGATEAHATFARKDAPAAKADPPHPLYGPPDFALVLPQARTKNGVAQTIKDVTDHPWAGAEVAMTLTARDEGGNEGRSEPFAFRLPERAFTKPLARALVEQRRNLALDARVRSQVITAVDALTLGPDKFKTDAGIYLGLRSIFWSLVRAKSDDDLRDVAARLWSMAVNLEDGDISEAQASLRAAQEALRNALDRGASEQELKQLMGQLRAAMDRFMQAMQEQLKNNQQLSRPLDRNSRMLRQQDLKNMLDRLESMARSGAKDAARELLQQLEQMMENLQMATPDMNGDDLGDMMQQLDDLGDMIHEQQDLRDRTFKQGQDERRRSGERAPPGKPGPKGQQGQQGEQGQQHGDPFGDLRQSQQALRDRLNKLLDDLKNRGMSPNQQGKAGQGQQGQGQGDVSDLNRAGEAMSEAEGSLGDGNADSAVASQGRALDALRKGAQGLAQSMQQQMGQGQGPGRTGRLGPPRAQQDTDPLGRPLRGREYGDDYTVKVPGEIDVQRARRIIEELRRRFGDVLRPQEELDYIERLLKDY
jgi:uncharacterized protein (TIGR02302 family)